MVSLSWRNELQKETVKRRIREKAPIEGAYAVVVLNTKDPTLVISGRTSTNIPITAFPKSDPFEQPLRFDLRKNRSALRKVKFLLMQINKVAVSNGL
jgi:hypothetical protein